MEGKINTQNILDMRNNLKRAASFDANNTYPSLFQHLGYRKMIAELLLSGGDMETMKEYEEAYERINNQIKLIIGL